jgi:hypothetical protein
MISKMLTASKTFDLADDGSKLQMKESQFVQHAMASHFEGKASETLTKPRNFSYIIDYKHFMFLTTLKTKSFVGTFYEAPDCHGNKKRLSAQS